MKIPVSWLRDFVDVPGSAEEIAGTMSLRGFAVEGVEADAGGETTIDFEVTANRPDCMSISGMAREIATAYDLPLHEAGSRGPGTASWAPMVESPADISILLDDPDLCPRYAGAVADVNVQASPAWMQSRLLSAAVRPISNIVDITNYVLLELGHPMHAFDRATIGNGQIRARRARQGETLRTLDGQLRTLADSMLVIADATRPIAIAGVMGGADTEVTAGTRAIVLESAYFNPLSVRRTSRALGLKTEASMRFERGADPHLPMTAMARAIALLELTGAGRALGHPIDRFSAPAAREPVTLSLRRTTIQGLLGAAVPDADIERILSSLGFSVMRIDGGWRVTAPTRRVDVAREVDLIEEIARHYGFDRLPVTFPALTAAAPASDPRIGQTRGLRTVMTGAGFSEAVTFGFIAEAAAAPFTTPDDLVPIANPLSETFGVLRPSVLPGLIAAVAHNRRREQRDVRLFEIGARFGRASGERRAIACAWTGAGTVEHWSGGARDVDFFDIKGTVDGICQALRVTAEVTPHQESWLVPGRAALLRKGDASLGTFGQLTPAIAEALGLPGTDPVYVAEVDLDAVEGVASRRAIAVEPLPRYPSVTRDVSILIDEALPAERVRATIHAAAPSSLAGVREFDRYLGQGVPEGKVSLSLRLTFRSPERTLTDADVQAAMDAVLTALRRDHDAIQR